jgi:hypothetical protein
VFAYSPISKKPINPYPEFNDWWERLDLALRTMGYGRCDFERARLLYRAGHAPTEAAERYAKGCAD